mmetsp:Transcript_53408/g.98765  ORF Transcript_53408/g.98765 Transcript_53408/m.98765 type:complete len:258 (+) Transcript_53408:75-848(+)
MLHTHFAGKRRERIFGLSCSNASLIRTSTVLSILMEPFWQESTTPPKHDGTPGVLGAPGRFCELKLSLHLFATPAWVLIMLVYCAEAGSRQDLTIASSSLRHWTVTSSSKSISRPWVIKSCTNCLLEACCTNCCLTSSVIFSSTPLRALIFSRRALLIAVERAMAHEVSTCFVFFAYSWRIFSFCWFTILNFSMLNSSTPFVWISSALSLASFKIKFIICWIWFCASLESMRGNAGHKPNQTKMINRWPTPPTVFTA